LLWAAVRKLSPDEEPDEVWIVGDTPRDIWASRRAGYRVAAVASGRYSLETLSRFQPDLLLPTLESFREMFSQRTVTA
jgi:phosphoglycolate phosphatase-like HAD superfamily hydrolase